MPMDRKLRGGNWRSPAKEGTLFSESPRVETNQNSGWANRRIKLAEKNESQSQWGERVDECPCPQTLPGFHPQVQQTQRWHLALWVFWGQDGSQETNVWEVPGTLELGP